MAGRPTKVYTIEDIEAKLEPWALSYLYAPEEEARQRFLLSEREKILTNESSLYDTAFSHMDQQDYMSMLVNIIVHGPSSIYLKDLPEPVKEKLLALEGRPTPRLLRKPLEILQEQLDKDEGQLLPKAIKSIMQGELYRDKIIVKDKLKQIYSATKFINLFYKWALTPPTNGRPNFYSCYTKDTYPNEIKAAFPIILIKDCDAVIDQYNSKELKKQEDLFAFIKNMVLKVPDYIKAKANQSTRNIKVWPFYEEPANLKIELGILDEIAQALEAVTLEDVTARPSTRKEKGAPLFTGIPKAFETGGYYPLLEEMDKQSEKDAQIDPFSNHKVYKSPHSRITIECDLSQGEIKKNVAVSKVTNTITFLANQNRDTVQATCEMEIGKLDYMRYMKLTEEQINDPIYRKNFFARQLKPFAFLRSSTWTIKDGKGKGRVGGIIDYAEINSKTVKFRFNKEFMQSVFLGFSPTPRTLESNKIPDIYPIEYYLQNKLENLFTNLRRQETNKNDIRQLRPLLEYLEQRGLLSQSETRYKEKLCNRIIKALDYLQNENKSIEYYLCATPDGPALEEEELEKYKNRNNFPNLYLWFNIPLLEEYIDPEQAKAIRKRIAEKKAKRKERQERAKDRKLGQLEAERLDKAREKAEAEAEAKAQNEQGRGKTLDEYYKKP